MNLIVLDTKDYDGFVIRRLAASGALPDGFRAEIPQAPPPVRARVFLASCPNSRAARQPSALSEACAVFKAVHAVSSASGRVR